MSYYIEDPNTKAVLKCNWVQYEQAKAFGYVHRILTDKVAMLHKPFVNNKLTALRAALTRKGK